MDVVYLILLLLALVCFAFAAVTRRDALDAGRGVRLVPLGLALWVAVPFLQQLLALD